MGGDRKAAFDLHPLVVPPLVLSKVLWIMNSTADYRTVMSGLGGSAMPAPMWNPTWGGWL
jgi:hypothetical protein